MTYPKHPSKLIDAQKIDSKEWAEHCACMANALIQTAQLAMENDNAGISEAERIGSAAYTLEVAQAIMTVVIDGTYFLSSQAKRNAA